MRSSNKNNQININFVNNNSSSSSNNNNTQDCVYGAVIMMRSLCE